MIREAELEEMETKWREQNAQIMAETTSDSPASAEAAANREPQLPLGAPPPP